MERLTAEERRAVVLEAAMTVFGVRGFLGTPTMDVAEAAGISHAYLLRLFPKNGDLVLAVVHRSNQRIYDTFAKVAAQARAEGRDPREALGRQDRRERWPGSRVRPSVSSRRRRLTGAKRSIADEARLR